MRKFLIFANLLVFINLSFAHENSKQKTDSISTASELENKPVAKKIVSEDSVKKERKTITKVRIGRILNVDIIDNGDDILVRRKKDSKKNRSITKNSANYDEFDDEFDDEFESDFDDFDNDDYAWYSNGYFRPHWAGFSLGINSYMGANFNPIIPKNAEGFKVNSNKSIEVNLNLLQLGIPIVKNHIGLVTGIGFKWNNYRFRNSQIRLHSDSSAIYYSIDTVNTYTKSKLGITYVKVPLLLEFQLPIRGGDEIYLSAGIEGALKIGARTRMKTNEGKKEKNKKDFHLSPYTLSTVVYLGYGNLGIYASYNLQALFQKQEGPELYPYSIGVSLNF